MEYEALIKIEANNSCEAGDIVAVREKGWSWGICEKKDFLIVNLGEMSEEDARVFESDISIEVEEPIREDQLTTTKDLLAPRPTSREIIAQRRYNVNIAELLADEDIKSKIDRKLAAVRQYHSKRVAIAKAKQEGQTNNILQVLEKELQDLDTDYQPFRESKVNIEDKIERKDIQLKVAQKIEELQLTGITIIQ